MSDLSGHRILVVDDDPDAREFIRTVLADENAFIIEAEDGIEALVIARREKPDLVTLDITMPVKGGAQVYEEMREDPELRNIPVCIVSGQPELRKLIYLVPTASVLAAIGTSRAASLVTKGNRHQTTAGHHQPTP